MTAPGPGGGLVEPALNTNPQADYADELYRSALDYISKGYFIYPVTIRMNAKGKKVASFPPSWSKESSTDRADIDKWFGEWGTDRESGIGIDCHKSGIVGVDLDGQVGLDNWAAIEAANGAIETTTIRTQSGGKHLYYRQIPGNPIYCTNGEIAPKVDIKGAQDQSGKAGGTLFAPPTRVYGAGGGAYSGEFPRVDELPLAPEWLPPLALKKSQKTEAARVAEGKAPLVVAVVTEERIERARKDFEANGSPAGLIRKLEQYVQKVADEPVNGRGEGLLNELVFELSHYAPHQIAVETIRTAFRDTVDLTWVEGHKAPGFDGIDHGLRHVGTSEHRPKVWDDRPVRSTSGSLFPSPEKPAAVARQLMESWVYDGYKTLRYWQGAWMKWDGPQYSETSKDFIKAAVWGALEFAQYSVTKGGEEELRDWNPNRNRVGDVIDAMQAATFLPEATKTPSWLPSSALDRGEGDPGPGMDRVESGVFPQVDRVGPVGPGENNKSIPVAFENGLLDVESRELAPLTPRFFNRASVPFKFDPEARQPAEWLKFLDSIWPNDPEAITTLQDWFGYVLSGRTDLQKALFVVGQKRSGKGTIARVLSALLGEANVASTTTSALATDFGLASLMDKSLAVMPDIRTGHDKAEIVMERLLSITGEDTVLVKRKYLTDWMGRIPARFMLMSNDLLPFRDPSGALNSRLVTLTLTRSFLGEEDTALEGRLRNELPGILNWSLEGLDRLTARGRLVVPASSATATQAMAASSSPIQEFLEERCVLRPGLTVPKSALFEEWKDWCDKEGHMPGSAANLGKLLFSAAPAVSDTRPYVNGVKVKLYSGVSLASVVGPTMEIHPVHPVQGGRKVLRPAETVDRVSGPFTRSSVASPPPPDDDIVEMSA